MISRTPDQRRHYDARLKWELDENTRIQSAFEEGEAKGKIEGETIGKIRTLQELLGLPISPDEAFEGKSLAELRLQASLLQDRIRKRNS